MKDHKELLSKFIDSLHEEVGERLPVIFKLETVRGTVEASSEDGVDIINQMFQQHQRDFSIDEVNLSISVVLADGNNAMNALGMGKEDWK